MRAALPLAPDTACQTKPASHVLVAASVLGISCIAWAATIHLMRTTPMTQAIQHPAVLTNSLHMLPMWVVMILAMMLPVATASIAGCSCTAGGQATPLGGAAFAAGYATSCVLLAACAAALGGCLAGAASPLTTAIGLSLVGLYQFLPVKLRALALCRGDLFRSRIQSSGLARRNFSSGTLHAANCFKCCGVAMLAPLFAARMSLTFMVLLFAWMLLEQAGWISASPQGSSARPGSRLHSSSFPRAHTSQCHKRTGNDVQQSTGARTMPDTPKDP